MVKIITTYELKVRLEQLHSLKNAIEKRKQEIMEIEIAGGLTYASSNTDLTMFGKEVDLCAAEIDRLEGRQTRDGMMGLCIPYDMPTFLLAFYTFPGFMAGLKCKIHLPRVMSGLERIWIEALIEAGIDGMEIQTGISGKEFGQYCVENPDIRHFAIAGSRQIVNIYSSKIVADHFETSFMFGPTRPKALFLDNADLDIHLKAIVNNSFFNCGQLCPLSKQFIATPRNYENVKEMMIQTVSEMAKPENYGTSANAVGPIKDGPAFQGAKATLERFSADSNYKTLVGGKVDEKEQVIQPTLVEASGKIDPAIDYFGPILILDKAQDDDAAVSKVLEDTVHGCFAYIFTNDFINAIRYEGILKPHCNMVRINTDIMSGSFAWPYGGYKDTFTYFKNGQKKHGVVFLSIELSKEIN
jgi:lactaldehyde dehydrogenase/glycolaldehyde dehydrogenase